jgi:hypothetical protein
MNILNEANTLKQQVQDLKDINFQNISLKDEEIEVLKYQLEQAEKKQLDSENDILIQLNKMQTNYEVN